ncbi:MAG TPA: CocE/NonD family hydrolase [Burkholderiales bacterium]|nr:CocE/NonD family hydrolase [Burkholderiales bacterium]
MKVVTRFPRAYTETEDCWIPMPDGVRLAAKLWLPDIAAKKRVPTIIEVIPYRKRDIYAPRDAMHHRYFAGHGYATMRVDIRGSGDSDGIQGVFATSDESEDTVQVLKWIAQQPWSDGQVGMFGISWGGFQGIQTAFRAPPELKAVIAQSYAPDRYRYSQVFRGGCILIRAIRWSSQVFGYKSRPPDPELVGHSWREMWMERLEHNTPQIIAALKHQTNDAYWRDRAIDHDRIVAPFFALSGWADGAYVGSVSESMSKLKSPAKAVIGPWGHRYGHLGMPGPAIGLLQEALRWYDHWMRGKDTGVEYDPKLIAWIARSAPAKSFYPESPGRWVAEKVWPSPRIKRQRFFMNAGGVLSDRAVRAAKMSWKSPQTLGLTSGELMPWFQHGPSPELPGDQRADDGQSLCFDSEPLTKDVDILGTPSVDLTLSVNRPLAFLCVRLCDVAPDGASTRVSYETFNLTHLSGSEKVTRLTPGREYKVKFPLIDTGYCFAKGHRIRVAISTTYWPLIWPSPEPVTLTLVTGKSAIELPVRPPSRADAAVKFKGPESAPPFTRTALTPGSRNRTITTDLGKGETVVAITDTSGRNRYDEIDLIAEARSTERYSLVEDEPLSATAEVTWTWEFERGDWRIRTESRTHVSCTKKDFVIRGKLEAYEGDKPVFGREFEERVPRTGN